MSESDTVGLFAPLIESAKCADWPMRSFVRVSIIDIAKDLICAMRRGERGTYAAGHP